MHAPATTVTPLSGRDRLLAAANDLFYAEGVQSVGIERIIERAGVAKATLYNNFASKEELIQAYLLSRHVQTIDRLTEAMAQASAPMEKILAVFAVQADLFLQPDFNGCAFAAASMEEPEDGLVSQVTIDFRRWIRDMFTSLATGVGASDPSRLGRQLHVLYDGAGLTARLDQDPTIADDVRIAVVAMVNRSL